ncbi:carboxylesterase family protein [Kitasatospora sp. MMS16-BH015]|uniref:carboxylesterase family protein n=1 Tax=Kitasatospora sp. MMS16-BH015 TaxID=2018025 RepID=UPI0020C1D0DC|nr:carboxylesterase family protein [Kitasatospora sp. MMS16-BH015]
MLTDRLFRVPSYRVAEARAEAAAPSYVYEFGWHSPIAPNEAGLPLGAAHSIELPFVWDTLDNPDCLRLTGPQPPRSLAAELHRRWVEFARTGELPGGVPYGAEDRSVLVFGHEGGAETGLVADPRAAERKLWEGVDFG